MNTTISIHSSRVPCAVQIPLWSMNTLVYPGLCSWVSKFRFLYGRWIQHNGKINRIARSRSDSSMVDEYYHFRIHGSRPDCVQIPLWSMNTDDSAVVSAQVEKVQIPLWSMNTRSDKETPRVMGSSDSSMVDEYNRWKAAFWSWNAFRFLYGRWIHTKVMFSSETDLVQIPLWSMNTNYCSRSGHYSAVQIPLWSMNTCILRHMGKCFLGFRFLYGRWIL